MRQFATAHDKELSNAQPPALFGQRALINEFRASFREGAFAEVWKAFVKFASQDKAKHRVSQEFQPLVMLQQHLLLVRDRWVRQREAQQASFAECITEPLLKCAEVRC